MDSTTGCELSFGSCKTSWLLFIFSVYEIFKIILLALGNLVVHQNGVLAIRQLATKRSSTDCMTFCIFLAKTTDCRSEMKWSKLVYTTRNHNSTERLVGGFSLHPLPIVKRGWFLILHASRKQKRLKYSGAVCVIMFYALCVIKFYAQIIIFIWNFQAKNLCPSGLALPPPDKVGPCWMHLFWPILLNRQVSVEI